ncbi:oligosaccharide flippase family protein [Limosilactobacillus reuteri]|uniref:Oligosaccharide flippase family protein n=1 Tax=Limosilactobacillus reuteri TaxID=1598 RepID=A0AAW6JCX0_LIMRT|nr:oligosaccharide flippase family protein [Limosilactobacillus reuteri]MDD1381480.1 oligosaccharide flippase family protein [Limosilactobacillus reuteri]MDD1398934.1 oligosaccharide flippase family protein [Limosilactobacillus reuteri]MDD1404909.1 oligosaccharide flippase family protein [Limosilactobacillus reuteri]
MKSNKQKVTNNIVMLYIMNATQLLLPLVTLPYLTRVLSVEGYGVVSYVKSLMVYVTLIIEFGYILSGTKEVLEAKNDKDKLSYIISKITLSKIILSAFAFIVLLIMIMTIPLLKRYTLFTILSFFTPFLSIFIYDYFFRGIEKMQIITMRYLIMRGTATILTFVFVKNESQLNLIPLLDIIGSLIAIVWVNFEIRNMDIKFEIVKMKDILKSLTTSFTYFISNVASTAFGALNTLLVGIYLSPRDVAYWGVVMSLVGAVQTMYSPISDGIYPRMIATKSLDLFFRIVLFFIPLLLVGSLITYFGAHIILLIIGGKKYVMAYLYLQQSIPLLIISFFSILFGWPLLGAINKIKEVTFSTVSTAILQTVGLFLLIVLNMFSITSILLLRSVTELFMALVRISFVYKYRKSFKTEIERA